MISSQNHGFVIEISETIHEAKKKLEKVEEEERCKHVRPLRFKPFFIAQFISLLNSESITKITNLNWKSIKEMLKTLLADSKIQDQEISPKKF